ncbi:MAG: glycosyltransferase family 39 protein [Gemmatimonadota bacterium]
MTAMGPSISAVGVPSNDRRILIAWVLAALVLRLPGHIDSGLWFDEIWLLVESIRVPFGTVFTTFESDNNHPFYTVLAWLSVHGLGESAWTLRLPAVLFGAASIGMMWTFALRVAPRAEATLATALLLVSYHHVWFSQNARGYTMLLFWTLAATHFFVRTLDGEGRRAWIPYGICLALATYTHASAVVVALAHAGVALAAVAVLSRSPEARSTRGGMEALAGLALGGVASLALHAAMLGGMLAFFTGESGADVAAAADAAGGETSPLAGSEWTSIWWTVRAVVESLGVPTAVGFAGLAVAAAVGVAGTWVVVRRDWRLGALYVLPVLLGVATTVGLGRPLRPRFFFHLSGFALLVAVAGIFVVARALARWGQAGRSHDAGDDEPQPHLGRAPRPAAEQWLIGGAAAVTLLASLAILPRAYTLPKQDFEGALAYVSAARSGGDAVATLGLTTLPYHDYYRSGFDVVDSVTDLDRLLAEHEVVFVLHTIPIFLESTAADLAARLVPSAEVARFRGSLGDGDVVVYRLVGGAP